MQWRPYSCFDVPDIQYPTPGHPWSVEKAHQDVSDRKLLNRRVRIYGDDIAAVVAEDEITARRALELIRVEYEEYPVVLEAEQAMAEGAPVLHEEHPDNVLAKMDLRTPMPESDFHSVEDVLACPAYYQFRGRYDTQQVQHCHIENPNDEPLAALDLKLRKEMQYELKRIQQEVGITFIFVTHDQEEALTMSDKIVVMKNGEIQQVGTPQDIYNEPANRFVANFIGESNIIPGVMLTDYKVRFDDITFDCVDFGFKEKEPVDVVIRPEDIDIVDVSAGKMTGEVLSVLFKGVHYEIMVETVPGTSVTVNMRVIRNHDIKSEDGKEMISANDFYVDIDDVEELDDKEIIALSNAQAWDPDADEFISIAKVEYELSKEEGRYPVTFSTSNGTSIEKSIYVVDQPFVKNEKANEGVMAFNFFKTVDEITESQALDTDLKTWAGAQAWKLSNEDEAVDLSVDYDFEPENVKEGVYQITFSTTGREFKIHTTDYTEEGQEVGLTFFPEDIHVMSREVF